MPETMPMRSADMKDSGERRQFSTGAVRDVVTGKPRPELVSPIMMERLAAWLAKGAVKYSDRNWEKAIPLSQSLGSLMRHTLSWMLGRTDEDHLAAMVCNAMFLIHTDEMIRRGALPAELDDLPKYPPPAEGK